jgi:tRNA-specific 2-thiouridylase
LVCGSAHDITVRLRSTHPGAPARLIANSDGAAEIHLTQPEAATARGQAAVCYRGDRLLGGGWITGTGRSAALEAAAA